jgi:hypothetical protein
LSIQIFVSQCFHIYVFPPIICFPVFPYLRVLSYCLLPGVSICVLPHIVCFPVFPYLRVLSYCLFPSVSISLCYLLLFVSQCFHISVFASIVCFPVFPYLLCSLLLFVSRCIHIAVFPPIVCFQVFPYLCVPSYCLFPYLCVPSYCLFLSVSSSLCSSLRHLLFGEHLKTHLSRFSSVQCQGTVYSVSLLLGTLGCGKQ